MSITTSVESNVRMSPLFESSGRLQGMVPCDFSYAYMGQEHLTSPSRAGFGVCSVDASGPALPTKGIQFVPLVAEAVGPVPPPCAALHRRRPTAPQTSSLF